MLTLNSFKFEAMGSDCIVYLYASERAEGKTIAGAAIAEVRRLEERYSRYGKDSMLSRINRIAAEGGTIEVDEETAGLVDYAYACYEKSDGLFDITSGAFHRVWDFSSSRLPEQRAIDEILPLVGLGKVGWRNPVLIFSTQGMELDLGGIAKEYAADRAAAICASRGSEHGLVNLGGDIRVIGPHPDRRPWHIKIRDPRNAETFLATVELHYGGLASSGDYERYIEVAGRRYCHIINPLTGWPAHGMTAVSVLADNCLVAGSASTVAMLRGSSGRQWLDEMGVRYFCLDEEGKNTWTTPFQPVGSET